MSQHSDPSRSHDLFGALLGLAALAMLLLSPWQVDTTGPDPFYKGPLLFPLMVLGMTLAGSLPSMWRLMKPAPGASWYLDGAGFPRRPLVMLCFLIVFLAALPLVGMEASTWLFLTISLKYLKQDSRMKLILIPALVTLILYLVFKVFLDIWFPEPLVMEWLFTGGE